MKAAEDKYSQGIDSTMAKVNDIAEQARVKAEERNKQLDELANQKINSNNYWGNMGTPDKIRSGIAILLGGIGAGLAGGKNLALEKINDAINKDIEDQKANKQSMYNALIQKGHNDEYATASVMKSMTDQIDALTKKYAAGTKSAESLQNLQVLNAQLKQRQAEYNQAQQGTALKDQVMNKALSGQDLSPQEMVYLPEKERNRYIPGLGIAVVGNEKAVEEARIASADRNNMANSIDQIVSIMSEAGREGFPTEKKKEAIARAAALTGKLRVPITGPGAMQEQDFKRIQNLIPEDPTALFNVNNLAKLNAAKDIINEDLNYRAKSLGINRQFGKQKSQSFLQSAGARQVAK
jgi:hypothetical protein